MKCDRCGTENPGDARFCLACGNPLTEDARRQVEEEPREPPAEEPQAAGTEAPPAEEQPEAQATEPQAETTEAQATEAQATEPRATEPRATEPGAETAEAPAPIAPEEAPERRPFLRPAGGIGAMLVGGWARALSRGAVAFAVLLFLAAVLVGLYEGASPTGLSPLELAKVVGLVFFAFHHVGVRAEIPRVEFPQAQQAPLFGSLQLSFTISVVFLLATFLALWLLYWGGRAVARQSGGSGLARAIHGAKVAIPYAALSFGLSFLTGFSKSLPPGQLFPVGGQVTFGSSHLSALLWPLFLGIIFGALGGLVSAERWMEAEGWTLKARGVLRGGLIMALYAVAFAFVGYLVVVALNPDLPVPFTAAFFQEVTEGGTRGILLLVVTVLAVPNLAVWVLVAAMGGSVVVDFAGFSYRILSYTQFPTGLERGAPEAAPLFGQLPGIPDVDTAPLPYFLFLLVPLLATLLGGWWAARKARSGSPGDGMAVGAGAGVVHALALTALLVMASFTLTLSGGLGPFIQTGRGHVGPPLLTGALLALVWGVAGGALGGFLAGRRAGRRAPAPERGPEAGPPAPADEPPSPT